MTPDLIDVDGGPRSRQRLRALVVLLALTLTVAWAAEGIAPAGQRSGDPSSMPAAATEPTEPPPSNVPMTRLAPGEDPPQFVLFSFDGGGWHERWQEFLAAAEPHDARFTVFLTGIYLLSDENRHLYTGPGHEPGRASISFGGTREDVQILVDDLNEAWLRGHEIGTHYNGHFCDGNDPSANDWSAADWDAEIAQFDAFWQNWAANNRIADPRPLLPPLDEVRGGRTPCLEGQWDQLEAAWANAGYTYDSSIVGSGMTWPRPEHGVWEFHMPTVSSPSIGRVVAMDYNFWVKMNGGVSDLGRAGEMRQRVLDTYRHMYDVTFAGNRAPLVIGNHFNEWSGDAFNPAVVDFVGEVCSEPDTYCATYSDVIAWMELQDAAVLEELQTREPLF